jgi:hypothetical protein
MREEQSYNRQERAKNPDSNFISADEISRFGKVENRPKKFECFALKLS